MSIRVAQWATGAVGTLSLGLILDRPELELVGVFVSDPAKEGKDAAELAGRSNATGILATSDRDALLRGRPDVVINAADADTRMEEAVDDLEWLLRAGVDVIASGPVVLQYPWGSASPEWIERLEAASSAGQSTLHITGIDPGFANDILPLTLTSIASRIDEIRAFEISDYSTYDNAAMVEGFFGFGTPMDRDPVIALPGVLASGWGGTVRQLAAALDVILDEQLTEHVERLPAPSDIDTVCTHIAAGTQAALRFEVIGTVDGEPRIALEHVLRARTDLDADLAPEWAAPLDGGPASFRVEISGEPNLRLELTHMSSDGDHGASGMLTTAARLANCVEAVHAAPPGIVSAKDLPLVTGRGLVSPRQS
ncbi:diacylglycerol kinase [Dietzia timorensis]|uniref:2,4-diaminopentanoate dehydrogenase C-terminal domain-containing protein n=1 Tax=Dietzia timorensis TaxID=499555 RepID=A0A173LPI8_9ACTN|nr:diacylglycerol kinase [Dietzia timorensis]ANI93843.1 Hypothetical protein BJL86_3084 [Dietzia timorensis]